MTEKTEFYRCNICGNTVQVLINGIGELSCCGEKMEYLEPQYEENEIGEKHVPEIENRHEGCENGVCENRTVITLRKHPMTKEHYIQFIAAKNKQNDEIRIKYLKPEQIAEYDITNFCQEACAVEYCNIHGLWRSKNA